MAQTAKKPSTTAKTTKTTQATKAPSAPTRAPAAKKTAGKKTAATRTAAQRKAALDRTARVSDDVLKSVESGQRAALDAVRTFVESIDEALPALGGHPSRREAIIDAALEMADKLVTTQYEFLRSVVRSAEHSLIAPPAATKTSTTKAKKTT